MHYLCSTFGSAGDVFPMLGLALELRARGHRVTLATNAHFAKLAAQYDVPFEELGTEAEFRACVEHPDLWHPRRALGHVLKFLQPVLKQQYESHVAAAKVGDVVGITNCFGFGALMTREKLGIPVLTLHLQPSAIWSDIVPPTLPGMFGPRWLRGWMYRTGVKYFVQPLIGPFLNAWRGELGLPPITNITKWWNSPDGVIGMFPSWFAPPQADWPANCVTTDFPLWNRNADAGVGERLTAFLNAGDAPIVFTPGSANVHGAAFFAAAIAACERLNRRGILLTEFPEQLPKSLPASVAHFAYIPLDHVLPRAAAFVHHGGIGSTSQAMAAGIPQIIMPLAHDQFDNAARLKALGIGDSLLPRKFTGPRLAAMLRTVIERPAVMQACRMVAALMTERDGLRLTADAVENIVARSPNFSATNRV